jgi:hypothetical protein
LVFILVKGEKRMQQSTWQQHMNSGEYIFVSGFTEDERTFLFGSPDNGYYQFSDWPISTGELSQAVDQVRNARLVVQKLGRSATPVSSGSDKDPYVEPGEPKRTLSAGVKRSAEALPPKEEMLTEKQAADKLGLMPQTLRKWRCGWKRGQLRGPRFFKYNDRAVRYDRVDIEHYKIASAPTGNLSKAVTDPES